MEIIRAEIGHFDAIYLLLCQLEGTEPDKPELQKLFAENIGNPELFYFVAVENERVLGFISLRIQSPLHHFGSVGEIQELVVDEGDRGHGIGGALFEHVRQSALSRGCSLLEVCCNQKRGRSHRFYLGQGMRNTHYKFTMQLDEAVKESPVQPAVAVRESIQEISEIRETGTAESFSNPLRWYDESIFYHIYPLGFCEAIDCERDSVNRLGEMVGWIPHMKTLGVNALYLGPIFESDRHGYDTRDYTKIDARLGTNADFAVMCRELRAADIKIVLDGVFNHVGRGFAQFQDVIRNKQGSRYKDWFKINFGGNSNYNDGFWYEGWEGHFELVKLNLQNGEVADYLLHCVRGWIEDYGIDGLRLDVAYSLDREFMRRLSRFTKEIKPDFFLLGECLHGDYNQFLSSDLLDSCTNYECYKGLYSSFNDMNMFEIAHSLNRQFGPEHWTLYKGRHLMAFVDNHDVSRIASTLKEQKHLPLIYGLLFTMPGIPCIYYGSEWGEKAEKNQGDDALRPKFQTPVQNYLSAFISRLCEIYRTHKALSFGGYRQLMLTNRQLAFERSYGNGRIIIAINADEAPFYAHIGAFRGIELITGKSADINGSVKLPGYSISIWNA